MTTRRKLFSLCAGFVATIGSPFSKVSADSISKTPEWELTNQLVDVVSKWIEKNHIAFPILIGCTAAQATPNGLCTLYFEPKENRLTVWPNNQPRPSFVDLENKTGWELHSLADWQDGTISRRVIG